MKIKLLQKRVRQPRSGLDIGAMTPSHEMYGPLVVWTPESPPSLDVVFVHGLMGNRETTWTKNEEGLGSVMWPRDLLPKEFPNARIITWGYDADVFKAAPFSPVSENLTQQHAERLCIDLSDLRYSCQERPIIFVAHSLGGIVVKQALLHSFDQRSSSIKYIQAISDSTVGVSFMGTPHEGTEKASLGRILANLVGVFKDVNTDIITSLQKEGRELIDLQRRFYELLRGREESGKPIGIANFIEEYSTVSTKAGPIVPFDSAQMYGYPVITVHADHREMVRFVTPGNSDYRTVVSQVRRWVESQESRLSDSAANASGRESGSHGPRAEPNISPQGGNVYHYGNNMDSGTGVYGGSWANVTFGSRGTPPHQGR